MIRQGSHNVERYAVRSVFLSIPFVLFVAILTPLAVRAQTFVPFPYGDMDSWVVREIKESAVLGGKTKLLYELGPTDTIRSNDAYVNRGGSPWANSNVLAKVAGVVKTNTSVFPEQRGDGWCARLETRYESARVLGIIDIEVIAAGSIHLGSMHEPIRGTSNPLSKLLNGIPFTERPTALRFDYRVDAAPSPTRIRSTGFSRKQQVEGQDSMAVILFLQHRWEDDEGNVFAHRVGTLVQRFAQSTNGWIDAADFSILYGDITSHPLYRDYMRIQVEERYTVNSLGHNVPICEIGWADADETPTHLILQFTSSHGGAYIGSPGNTLRIDNVGLVYE